jgi:hypothetical protein
MMELKPRSDRPGGEDPDGVRVVAGDAKGRRGMRVYLLLALALSAGCVGYVLMPRTPPPSSGHADIPQRGEPGSAPQASAEGAAPGAAASAAGTTNPAAAAVPSTRSATPRRVSSPPPGPDPGKAGSDEVADFMKANGINPKDVTAGEYIQALHDAGIHTGIGAFNPPGTSPPLEGLAVPEDYELPEGFVRHYQTTDDGVAIEPILMYSPDYEFVDADGNPIPIPADRVVPPENVPPGFPIRPIEMPPKREPGDLSR